MLAGMLVLFLTQVLAFIQTNGQFIWPWFKRNPILVAIMMGSVIGLGFIVSAEWITQYFDTIWPARIMSFSLGVLSFTLLAWWLKGEPLTMKNVVSLMLALVITLIQIFWNEESTSPSLADGGDRARTECTD